MTLRTRASLQMNIIGNITLLFESKLRNLAIKHLNLYPYRRYMTKNNCIFIHIPKAAGTSVLQALNGTLGHIQRDHFTITECITASRKHYEEFFSFAFTREPLDRALSTYNYLVNGGNKTTDLALANTINNNFSNFDEYVAGFLDHDTIHVSKLTKPQFCYVCDERFSIKVDFVGSFENINDDFKYVARRLGLDGHLPQTNYSKKSFYEPSDTTKAKLYELYKRDYELFYPDQLDSN